MQERLAGCRTFSGTGYISLLFYDQFFYLMYIRKTESCLQWLLKLSVPHPVNLTGPCALRAQARALRGGKGLQTTSLGVLSGISRAPLLRLHRFPKYPTVSPRKGEREEEGPLPTLI